MVANGVKGPAQVTEESSDRTIEETPADRTFEENRRNGEASDAALLQHHSKVHPPAPYGEWPVAVEVEYVCRGT